MKKNSFKQRLSAYRAKRRFKKNGGKLLRKLILSFNRYISALAGILIIYFTLLLLIVYFEKNAPGSTIHNLGQAIWYSLATFSTVGYGDFYPITPAGRIVASVFLILGIGLLGFFVGFMIDFFSRIRPLITLSLNTDKPWYIFSDKSPYSVIFAENLKKVRPDAMIIYANTSDDDKSKKSVSVNMSVEELIDRRGSLYDAHIICMKEDEMENFLDSISLSDIDVPIICLASFTPSHYPININFFSLSDSTARIFWQQYPIKKPDETVILIGFDSEGTVLLDRGLELNVLYEKQSIHYHIFGDSSEYCRNRKLLSDIVSINKNDNDRDCIFFHDDLWNSDENLLKNADRIILCSDSEQENIAILHTIQKFFSIKGNLYIYNSNVRSVATPFGQTRDILTPAFVLHNRLTDMALCRHELFRLSYGDESIPMWEETNSLTKDMNFISTDHISLKVRIVLGDEAPTVPFDELEPAILRKAATVFYTAEGEDKEHLRRIEHERSIRFYKLHNYRYGSIPDDDERTNPLLMDYDKLNENQKAMSDTSWMLLDELAAHKEAKGR